MHAYFSDIEDLLSDFDTVDNSSAVYSSLAWSFAMSAAQTLVRLQRVYDVTDPRYSRLTPDQKAETTTNLEQRLDNFGELVSWFCRGGNPEWNPTGEQVARLIQSELTDERGANSELIEEIAAEMDASIEEVKTAVSLNRQRLKEEQTIQRTVAEQMIDEIVATIDRYVNDVAATPDTINQNDAIRIVNKIADKAAQYASNRLVTAIRQVRKRRRDALNGERRLLVAIESKADTLLSRLEHERDGAFMDTGSETTS